METKIGPISRNKFILCSADAGPDSQRRIPDKAGYFFPKAKWVGAIRNSADLLGCKFVILTTGHGMVEPDHIIAPFDAHIDTHFNEVSVRWASTIQRLLEGYKNGLMLFYAGGCPRDPYLETVVPILQALKISLLTFGRPNMFDVDKIEPCAQMLFEGTTLAEIRSILKLPYRLKFYA